MLDRLARRYHCRPSDLLRDIHALWVDLLVAGQGDTADQGDGSMQAARLRTEGLRMKFLHGRA